MNSPRPPRPETLSDDILQAAEAAYLTMEADPEWSYEDRPYKLAVCGEASHLMLRHLTGMGHRAQQEIRASNGINQHCYIVFDFAEGEVIADGTWQQFLPIDQRSDDLPHVLIGTREEVIEQARALGVNEDRLHLWESTPVRWIWDASRL